MRARWFAVALAWALLLACAPSAPAQPLQVVATIAPLADWTREIGRERVAVNLIVPVGVDPATYEPSEQQQQQIIAADIVILNGLGLEPWLDPILQQSRSGQIVLELSQYVAPPSEPDPAPTPTPPAAVTDQQVTPTAAPAPRSVSDQTANRYQWLDPRSAIQQVDIIARTLMRADDAGFVPYRQNAARYAADIENLDARIEREVQTWPVTTVRSPDRFLYPFTQRFGLTLELVDAAEASNTLVFVNRFTTGREAAQQGGVMLNPLGGSTYDELMQTLLVSMTDAIKDERGLGE